MTSTTRFSLALIALLLAGCATTVYRPLPLPLVAHPKLPAVTAADFKCPILLPSPWTMCITDATYEKLVDRERGYKTWGSAYEAEVKVNNAKAAKKP